MSDFFFQIDPGIHILERRRADRAGHPHLVLARAADRGARRAIAGMIIGAPTLRLKSDYLALVTLGFGEIMPQVFRNGESIKGFNLSNGTKGIAPVNALDMYWLSWTGIVDDKINVFDYTTRYYVIFALCLLFVLVSLRLRDGRLGPGVAGDPRGRAGRQPDGRAADADQALGVRRRRGRRRYRRRLLLRVAGRCERRHVQLPVLGDRAVHGRSSAAWPTSAAASSARVDPRPGSTTPA